MTLKGLQNPSRAPPTPSQNRSSRLWNAYTLLQIGSISVLLASFLHLTSQLPLLRNTPSSPIDFCPQANSSVLIRNADIWEGSLARTGSDGFRQGAAGRLAGAVRIPTESYDDLLPVGVDPRWDVFALLHGYLEETFPLVYSRLDVRRANTYGLIIEWTGSDATLKPVLFTAHQDVVPVEPLTVAEWTHPPYSGHFDGQRIWGRGTADDKNGLIAILQVNGPGDSARARFRTDTDDRGSFRIRRRSDGRGGFCLYWWSGFLSDLRQGAAHLANAMLDTYGEDAFAFIVDEGSGLLKLFGTVFAMPEVAEKGYMDVTVNVTTAGGHSSIPPDHTSIGILATVVVEYENHPHNPYLTRHSPSFQTFQCLAQYAADMPPPVKAIISKAATSESGLHVLEELLYKNPLYRIQIMTTQAVDVIKGGVKANALPEQASVLVNHRISIESSIAQLREHNTALMQPLATRFNLSFRAFGEQISDPRVPTAGLLSVGDDSYPPLEPSPVTPTIDSVAYEVLSASIKATYARRRVKQNGDSLVVAPSLMVGNTDTSFYWTLSPNIFRYGHGNSAGLAQEQMRENLHTVDESLNADDFVEMIRFFVTLMLSADESLAL
ncbi:unnamed protein product [Mycena citricolor]|uniref:Peptidase M20 dimerisation domain-containing protein n=1 Tax=Mycena citricolor TaxID=2018698 RepID=A0AAD2H643_9AGAR|nr:unnamed protein product [Mycena citricolor]